MKIFAHRSKEQNWLSAVPIKSHVFQELKNNEHVRPNFPLLFTPAFLLWPPPPRVHHLYFVVSPGPLSVPVCLNVVFSSYLCFFIFFFFVFCSFLLILFCFVIGDLLFACYFLFRDVLFLVLDYFPKVLFLSLLSLLSFILTTWIICELLLYSSQVPSAGLNSNWHLSSYLKRGDCQFLSFFRSPRTLPVSLLSKYNAQKIPWAPSPHDVSWYLLLHLFMPMGVVFLWTLHSF